MFVKASTIRDLVSRAMAHMSDLVSALAVTFHGPQLDERAVLVPVRVERRDPRLPR
ncbi:hypothetical protein [Shimia haliotis]|uniref:Uncharacterized protein n=1 Tax=Shimia haliotis TaxID=1280847 RepID=A0A1I4CVM4_9RHOB|nr:hypothetical protein [Shimia haliotis]SFK83961.1 hypothetical protein SAMN04488036_102467 [Shimia haliotis]